MKSNIMKILSVFISIIMLCSCSYTQQEASVESTTAKQFDSISEIEEYTSFPYAVINSNEPDFDLSKYTSSFETYSELDELGRCGVAFANISQELMPNEERGSIGSVRPSGWQTVKFDCVDGKYLYNRCHLIGYQLTAENANEKNLITGTRYMNVEGMLDFENEVAEYIHSTGNHVLYRVTPHFKDDELVARGVQIEAESVEDNGEGIKFNVYCYNVQPDIEIDYKTGESTYIGNEPTSSENEKQTYIVNTSTKKFHTPDCPDVKNIKESNRKNYFGHKQNLIDNGYSPCSKCNKE